MKTRAASYREFGPPSVLRVGLFDIGEPSPRQVVVQVHAAAVNPKDVLMRKGKLRWMVRTPLPRQTAQDFAGVVTAVGSRVVGVPIGTRVFGMINRGSGGAAAQTLLCKASELAVMPDAMSHSEGAAIPLAGQTALQALRNLARVRAGHRVLIHGASGGVGSFAIQVAKCLGAFVVSTSSARNGPLCRTLGADEALDYRVDTPWRDAGRFDAIFDVFGNRSFSECREALRRRGVFITTVPSARAGVDWLTTVRRRRRAKIVLVRSRRADLQWLAARYDAGELRPQIDRHFSLDAIADAHTFVETKRARGKVILDVVDPSP